MDKKLKIKVIVVAVPIIVFLIAYNNTKLFLVPRALKASGLDNTDQVKNALRLKTNKELREIIR